MDIDPIDAIVITGQARSIGEAHLMEYSQCMTTFRSRFDIYLKTDKIMLVLDPDNAQEFSYDDPQDLDTLIATVQEHQRKAQ